eukprot:990085-Pleurochrysis_carterae.AAC.1
MAAEAGSCASLRCCRRRSKNGARRNSRSRARRRYERAPPIEHTCHAHRTRRRTRRRTYRHVKALCNKHAQ